MAEHASFGLSAAAHAWFAAQQLASEFASLWNAASTELAVLEPEEASLAEPSSEATFPDAGHEASHGEAMAPFSRRGSAEWLSQGSLAAEEVGVLDADPQTLPRAVKAGGSAAVRPVGVVPEGAVGEIAPASWWPA